MKYNFCTLFDTAYLSRGLAMYDSLERHCKDFHLYIFAFDDNCYQTLKSINKSHLTVISLSEFEDEELLKIKPERTKGEYCWTCTSSTILYILNNFKVDNCTYLDADLYFFSSPQPLIEEMKDNSVMITEHRYTKKYDQSEKSGIYCVQFVTFKNDDRGLKVLIWWRNACIEWCYNRFEDGKFGDQKYLDDWTSRFEGIHVLQHLGGGVAPWNMQQYSFSKNGTEIVGKEIKTGKLFEVIFFHFHSLHFVNKNFFMPHPYYKNNRSAMMFMFKEYIKKIKEMRRIYNMSEHYMNFTDKLKLFTKWVAYKII
ncbi:MAG: glycosyl transferase [Bacteroidales bacterium]|nr:glycosyl transferase [Bacteroidales bacterium]